MLKFAVLFVALFSFCLSDHGRSNESIAIIGAGASGLTAAHTLRHELGHKNITIFEAKTQAGGKVETIFYNGKPYEMGAIVASEHYKTVFNLAKFYNVPYQNISLGGQDWIYSQGKKQSYVDYVRQSSKLTDLGFEVMRFYELAEKYKLSTETLYNEFEPEFYRPFSAFARRHKIENLGNALKPLVVASGYGYYETTPALYIMKFLTAAVDIGVNASINSVLSTQLPTLYRFPNGFQSLWLEIAKRFPIQYGKQLIKIEKIGGQSQLHFADGSSGLFDKVIFSLPFDQVGRLFEQPSLRHKWLTQNMSHIRYFVTLFRLPKRFLNGTPSLVDNMMPSGLGRAIFISDMSLKDEPVYQAYQFADSQMSEEELQSILIEDLRAVGANVDSFERIETRDWRYFQHANEQALTHRYYKKVDEMQGQNGWYFIGGSLNFETVETASFSGRDNILRYFPKM